MLTNYFGTPCIITYSSQVLELVDFLSKMFMDSYYSRNLEPNVELEAIYFDVKTGIKDIFLNLLFELYMKTVIFIFRNYTG